MVFTLDFSNNKLYLRRNLVVFIIKNRKGGIVYHSGFQRFDTKKQMEIFSKRLMKEFEGIHYELHFVDVYKASPIDELKHRSSARQVWCPYCQSWQIFKSQKLTHKQCPVCGVSDQDYWLKKYNHTWGRSVEGSTTSKGGKKK